ncbi:hypothetical protein BDV95DRAFT_566414 [Massariosphaeria phaeospora]|uniref:DUF7580 domain-containing protein n=1 Tax=Massariosphaeria phaeospora TaxID=100035 RepID=A0A7C8IAA0_9PLEO|nr:hypothetical protein BDV95DRAFT_566414 [Massariosphaeria phaeospora]
MSGIEVAGLALGAIPVLIEAIKAYQDAHDKIQIFKHATSQLRIVDGQFMVCRLAFHNECRLLLDLIFPNQTISKEMVEDANHHLWRDDGTKQQLGELLKDHADACATIVADTHSNIQEFKVRLSKFQVPAKSSSGRLQRARFVLEKSRFERDIANLRKRNADLSLLRSQLIALESRPKISLSTDGMVDLRPISKVRTASDMLHDTLKDAWSCLDNRHLHHLVKLCVETGPESCRDSVTLDMAISCEIADKSQRDQSRLICLYVRSNSFAVPGTRKTNQLQHFAQSLQQSLPPPKKQHPASAPTSSSKPNPNLVQQTTTNISPLATAFGPTSGSGQSQTAPDLATISNETDICKIASICSYFEKSIQNTTCSQPSTHCLGYLKSTTDSKYLFYTPSAPGVISKMSSASAADEVTSLITLIERSPRGPSEVLHQYELALKLSKSVLQFHGTAWLGPVWKLKDLSIFGSELSTQSLTTLHLSTQFDSEPPNAAASAQSLPTTQAGDASSTDAYATWLCPAIYNETLFSLGVALLEIAHWQPLRSMKEDDANEFWTAHRLVRGRPPLGAKYRMLVERCLRCEFGVDSKSLEDNELQQAVWSKVVSPLEALIRFIG